MTDVQVGETAMLECQRCHGVWIDAATFEHVCSSQQTQAAVLHQWQHQPSPARGEVRYRKCVACGKMMNRLNFGKLSGTVVDVCRGHGTFLDAGELHAIVTFIQGGGLERARQRQIEELREHEQRLRYTQLMHDHATDGVKMESQSGLDLLSLLAHLRNQ